jgi:hypothetical protein
MGFSKSDEYIDYTLLKKKGILKLPEEKKLPIKTEGGFVDFTAFGSPAEPAPTTESPTPNFDFLSNMAGVGNSNSSTGTAEPAAPVINPFAGLDTFMPSTPATSASQISGSVDGKELNAMKIKMDDMEYKLDRFIERLDIFNNYEGFFKRD